MTVPLVEMAREDDLAAIGHMRVAEDWQANRWLIEAVHRWDGGRLFVVRSDVSAVADAGDAGDTPRLLAVTSAVAYGDRGFIGNVIVHPAARRRGLGRMIMQAAIDWLADRGVRRVELDATVHGRPLYEQLGFVGTVPSWVLWGPMRAASTEQLAEQSSGYRVVALDARQLNMIGSLDHAAIGGSRLALLECVCALEDTRGYVAHDAEGRAAGYVFVRPLEGERTGLRLGPWVARTPRAATALLAHAIGTMPTAGTLTEAETPYMQACIPGASHVALDTCARLGLTVIQDDLRMQLDLPVPQDDPAGDEQAIVDALRGESDWIYGMLAPMVG